MRDNVFISAIRHPETSRNCAKFFKPNSFIKMQCVGVGSNNCVKLQNTKLFFFCHFQTVKNQLFTDIQPADIFPDSIAGITDVTTSSNIIWMQDGFRYLPQYRYKSVPGKNG